MKPNNLPKLPAACKKHLRHEKQNGGLDRLRKNVAGRRSCLEMIRRSYSLLTAVCTALSSNNAAICIGLAWACSAKFSSRLRVFGDSRTRRCSLHEGSVERPPPSGTRKRDATSAANWR